MTILYPAPAKVNRTARRFGAGILPTRPSYAHPCTSDDAAWWAAELRRSEDEHADRLARESHWQDRLEAGICM